MRLFQYACETCFNKYSKCALKTLANKSPSFNWSCSKAERGHNAQLSGRNLYGADLELKLWNWICISSIVSFFFSFFASLSQIKLEEHQKGNVFSVGRYFSNMYRRPVSINTLSVYKRPLLTKVCLLIGHLVRLRMHTMWNLWRKPSITTTAWISSRKYENLFVFPQKHFCIFFIHTPPNPPPPPHPPTHTHTHTHTHTVTAKNIGTLGKYYQRRLWKCICIVNPFYLLFKKCTKIEPLIW